jgi:hypothetical protein
MDDGADGVGRPEIVDQFNYYAPTALPWHLREVVRIQLRNYGNQHVLPSRHFGKTDVRISALGLGGHHLGVAKDERSAVEIVHRALDGGITFYDCCWEYIAESPRTGSARALKATGTVLS